MWEECLPEFRRFARFSFLKMFSVLLVALLLRNEPNMYPVFMDLKN